MDNNLCNKKYCFIFTVFLMFVLLGFTFVNCESGGTTGIESDSLYNIWIDTDLIGGTISVNMNTAMQNTEIKVTAAPETGNILRNIIVSGTDVGGTVKVNGMGETITLQEHEGDFGCYVRAVIIGTGGVVFTQAFVIDIVN